MKTQHVFIFFISLLIGTSAYAIELMRWERVPLAVPLIVGQERVIFVDRNVRVGVPASIQHHLRVQTANGTVYLLAQEAISPTRIQLQDAQTGELILIDIAAMIASSQQSELEPIRIIEGEVSSKHYGASVSQSENITGNASKPPLARETPVPVILTRYAAQNLYAPLRTVEPVQGIGRVNLRRDLDLSTLLPLLPVNAKPLAAWRLEDFVVTAVKLQNTAKENIILDPRMLQGNFIAATFQHPTLGSTGTAEDTTVVYLITQAHGLHQAILPHISRFDAQVNTPERNHEK